MAIQQGRVAFKSAIERFESPNPKPLTIRKMPFAESLDATIVSLSAGEQKLSARFTCGPEFIQGAGVVQGGVVAAMLDLAMAFVSLSILPAELTCATAQLNIHFLAPAKPGTFHATAEVEKSGKRVLFSRAALFPADGSGPVASATAVFTILSAESLTVARDT